MGKKVFKDISQDIKAKGFNHKVVKGLIYNPFESQLHPGEMMRHLWAMAGVKGIEILTGAQVKKMEPAKDGVDLFLRGNLKSDKLPIKANKVAVCTNGFTREFFPDIKLLPGRGQVIITEPISKLKIQGTYHMDRGFYYFRNVGDRLLFGGGRNLQIKEETTTKLGDNKIILETLKGYLENIILPGRKVKIAQKWSGIMAFGADKRPIIKEYQPNVFLGVRLGGMGVAIGTTVGEKLAVMMTGKATV